MSYVQSTTMAEIEARHPFPWQETRFDTYDGVEVKVFDARGEEVIIFELTALARIVTRSIVASRSKKAEESPT